MITRRTVGVLVITWSWLAAALLIMVPLDARAHTVLVRRSDPVTGSVGPAPSTVTIEFTGRVRPDVTTLVFSTLDPATGGVRVVATRAPVYSADGTTVSLAPRTPLTAGRYRLGYQTVLSDGDPGVGYIEFEVSADGQSRAAPWPTPAVSEQADLAPLSRQRLQTDAALPWVLGGAVVLTAGVSAAIVVSGRRSRRLGARE